MMFIVPNLCCLKCQCPRLIVCEINELQMYFHSMKKYNTMQHASLVTKHLDTVSLEIKQREMRDAFYELKSE